MKNNNYILFLNGLKKVHNQLLENVEKIKKEHKKEGKCIVFDISLNTLIRTEKNLRELIIKSDPTFFK